MVAFSPRCFTESEARAHLLAPTADDDKYRRGVVGLRTGSPRFPGAAVLSVTSAWAGGAGMVRYVPTKPPHRREQTEFLSPSQAVLAARPETVFGAGRSDTWVVGSGTSPDERPRSEAELLHEILRQEDPVVLDAGALDMAHERLQRGHTQRAPLVLTPHWGEFEKLWNAADLPAWPSDSRVPELSTRATAALRLAHKYDAVFLLKGSHTVVASPDGDYTVVGPNSPFLATAGTGDVLAGLLGALLAAHVKHGGASSVESLAAVAATGALVHSRAAEIASGSVSADRSRVHPQPAEPRSIVALDVAHAIPRAVASLRGGASADAQIIPV
jgi:hydroxyethylthiazole kinase-like uncharacterized protein yjeF